MWRYNRSDSGTRVAGARLVRARRPDSQPETVTGLARVRAKPKKPLGNPIQIRKNTGAPQITQSSSSPTDRWPTGLSFWATHHRMPSRIDPARVVVETSRDDVVFRRIQRRSEGYVRTRFLKSIPFFTSAQPTSRLRPGRRLVFCESDRDRTRAGGSRRGPGRLRAGSSSQQGTWAMSVLRRRRRPLARGWQSQNDVPPGVVST